MNWKTLIDERALAELFPASLKPYARLVAEGLTEFLSHLPADIRQEILAKQLALPVTATQAERIGALAKCSPVLQKLGQTLARDQRLAAELRCELRSLESMTPPIPLEIIQQTLVNELGDLSRLGIELAPPAIAEASVAVVIPFRQSTGRGTRHGVFKILKPGIETRLALELELLDRVGHRLDELTAQQNLAAIDYRDAFEQIRTRLLAEVDLAHERSNLISAARCYAWDRDVVIPEVYDFSTSRVTAMQRIYGVKVTDALAAAHRDRVRIAKLIVRTLITRPLLAGSATTMFHCDPHAGNLLYTDDGRLGVLDWSLTGQLSRLDRQAMVQIILAAITLRSERIINVLISLSVAKPRRPAELQSLIDRKIGDLLKGQIPSLSWAVGLLDEAVILAGLKPPADLLLFRKSLLTLEGVTAELAGSSFKMDDCLTLQFLRQLFAELPARCLAPAWTRNFGTQLSNADLLATCVQFPLGAAAYWLDKSKGLISHCPSPRLGVGTRATPAQI